MYIVSITREGNEWVARDKQNNKRAWGEYKGHLSFTELAEYLFHKSEIGVVKVIGGITYAAILEGEEITVDVKFDDTPKTVSKAEAAYVAAHATMNDLLATLSESAKNIPCHESPNWEHVGTLCEINRRLESLIQFVNGDEK